MASSARATPVDAGRPDTSRTSQLVAVLQTGGSIFGLGHGCEEWRAVPGETGIVEDEAPDPHSTSVTRDAPAWTFAGRITASPDEAGRVYSFAYYVDVDQQPVRVRITGRGSWAPAPGVKIRSQENPEHVVFGSASYCISELDVRETSVDGAVLVGDEPWFLTRDACMRQDPPQGRAAERRKGCKK